MPLSRRHIPEKSKHYFRWTWRNFELLLRIVASLRRSILVSILLLTSFVAARAPINDPVETGGHLNDSMSCNGKLVVLGDREEAVLAKCGRPIRAERRCEYVPVPPTRILRCTDEWTYQPDTGSFPRYVSFFEDKVVSIRIGTRFD